ncbi:MAG: 2'-5' RNA ligase family protein [Gammaproteobacteria bacterium]|nr:2'-5' RNA ligase family protein [Gammaproteobacteria bacterium]
MIKKGARPHVSLLVGRGIREAVAEDKLRQLASRFSNIEINFSHLGFFPIIDSPDNHVVHIGVTPTEQLLALHNSAFQGLQHEFEFIEPHYAPEEINLHCTLALDLKRENIKPYFEIVQSFALPKSCECNTIDIVEYFPATHKTSIALTDHK